MKKIIKLSIISLAILPLITFAKQKDLKDIIDLVLEYFKSALFLIMGLAVVMFVWNVFKYFIKGSDSVSDKKEAGLYVMWSIIGFFVILSFWGIVNIFTTTLKLNNNTPSGFFGSFSSSGGNDIVAGGTNSSPSKDIVGGGTVTNTGRNPGIFVQLGTMVSQGYNSLFGKGTK